MQTSERRPLMIANGWIQAAGIVLIIGFFIMGVLAYYTYSDEPPMPRMVQCSSRVQTFWPDSKSS
jgi:nitric oxide reductase subunit B